MRNQLMQGVQAGQLTAQETRAASIQNRMDSLLKRASEIAERQDSFLSRMRGSVPQAISDKPGNLPANSHLSIMENYLDYLQEIVNRFEGIAGDLETIA